MAAGADLIRIGGAGSTSCCVAIKCAAVEGQLVSVAVNRATQAGTAVAAVRNIDRSIDEVIRERAVAECDRCQVINRATLSIFAVILGRAKNAVANR